MDGAWGSTPSMEWRMSERATAASSEVKRLLGEEITAATSQTESRTATHRDADAEDGVDVAQVVPAHGDVAPGAEDPAGVAQRAGGEQDEGHDQDRAGDVAVAGARAGAPTPAVPRRKPRKKPPKVRSWTRAPSRSPWTAASSISPMISRSTQSTAARVANGARGNAPPTAIVVVPCLHAPCLDTGVSGDAVAACSCFSLPWPHRVGLCADRTPGFRPEAARVLGQPEGTPLAVGQPAPAGTGELGAVSCATARRCWAVGVAGPEPARPPGATVIVATTNGGATWKAQQVAGGSTPQLSGVSLPDGDRRAWRSARTGRRCREAASSITTSDAGATWSPAASPHERARRRRA